MSNTPRTDAATHTEEGREWLQEDAYRLHELSKQLERELTAALKDAERYRWLRKEGNHFEFEGYEGCAMTGDYDVINEVRGDDLDAAIDAAITKEKS